MLWQISFLVDLRSCVAWSGGKSSHGAKQLYPLSLRYDINLKIAVMPFFVLIFLKLSSSMIVRESGCRAKSNSRAATPVAMEVETEVPEIGFWLESTVTCSPRMAKFICPGMGSGLYSEILSWPSVEKIGNTSSILAGYVTESVDIPPAAAAKIRGFWSTFVSSSDSNLTLEVFTLAGMQIMSTWSRLAHRIA